MNALKPMGLLASGRMIDSTLLRVPHLGPAFGPIVAGSKRLPVCNPLHNRSLSPAVNRKPSISRVIKDQAVPGEAEAASRYISLAPNLAVCVAKHVAKVS